MPGYLRAVTNQETASLLGPNTKVGGSSTVPAGTTTLAVAAAAGRAAGPRRILDGPFSEMVRGTGSPDGTHLTLAAPGTRFAPAPGASASQAGASDSLAELLLRASAWIGGYCEQS